MFVYSYLYHLTIDVYAYLICTTTKRVFFNNTSFYS